MTVTFNADVRGHLDTLLKRFERAAQPGPFEYKWCHHADGGRHPVHVVFGVHVSSIVASAAAATKQLAPVPAVAAAAVAITAAAASAGATEGGRQSLQSLTQSNAAATKKKTSARDSVGVRAHRRGYFRGGQSA